MNRYILKKYYLILVLFSLASLQLRADVTNEVALSFTSALSSSTGTAASSTVGDITFSFSGTHVSYSTDHVTLGKNDLVKVSQVSGSGSAISSIKFYLYGSDNGALSLNSDAGTFKSYVWSGSATTVQFKNNYSKTVAIQAIVVTYTKSSTVSFSAQEETYSLEDLFVSGTANTATSTTSGATITYSVLNTKVAQIDANGFLRFVNDGWTTVSGSDGTNTAYYAAHITTQEIEPSDYVSGNVLDMSKVTTEGEINATSVKLPYMTIGIGSTSETAVLKNLSSSGTQMGIVCLDANGYNHAYAATTGTPTMGTYFSFTPLTNGTLTVKGYFNSNGGGTNAAKLYQGATEVATIAFDATNEKTLTQILEAGKTYYLYVPTSTGNFDYFCPNYISYVSNYYFSTKSVTVTSGSTYTQTVNGGSSVTYSVKAKGDLTSASVTTDGVVTWSGDGGALVVTATDGSNSDFYVITVPYSTHTELH